MYQILDRSTMARKWSAGMAAALAGVGVAAAADFELNQTLTRFTFGSCNAHNRPQPMWQVLEDLRPQVWAWIGDIVYTDRIIGPGIWVPQDHQTVAQIWQDQKQRKEYSKFAQSEVQILGVWDDHDYGHNNAGSEFGGKELTQKLLLDFLDEPADSLRRSRDGVYASYGYGTGDSRVLLIMLDVRYFREKTPRFVEKHGHMVQKGYDDDMLGSAQWDWLEQQLRDDAPVKLIASGIQVIADTPIVESWMHYPQSKKRLLNMIQDTEAKGVVFLSGDVHFAEMSCCREAECASVSYPLFEFTSSGMTHVCLMRMPSWLCEGILRWVTRGYQRIGHIIGDFNIGLIDFDWKSKTLHMQVVTHDKSIPLEHTITISNLSPQHLNNNNNCPTDQMLYMDAWRWHITLLVFVVLVLVVPVYTVYILAKCLKAICCPNWSVEDKQAIIQDRNTLSGKKKKTE